MYQGRHTLIGPAVSEDDYELEIARRMWCAAVAAPDEDDEDDEDDTEEIERLRMDGGLSATTSEKRLA